MRLSDRQVVQNAVREALENLRSTIKDAEHSHKLNQLLNSALAVADRAIRDIPLEAPNTPAPGDFSR